MKKILLFIVNSILTVIAVLLTGAVFVQVIMTAGLLWLGSAKGQVWLSAQLAETAATSGYTLSVKGLTYHSMQGVMATNVVFGDKDGEIFRADRLMAHVALLPLLDKHAAVSLKGTNVVVSRLPAAQEPVEPSAPLQPFTLPDIYVTSLGLSISANRLELKAPVAGQDMILAPVLKASVDLLDQNINVAASLKLGQPADKIVYLPDAITLKGIFSSQDLKLSLEHFNAVALAYQVSAEGNAGLMENGPLDLKLSAMSDDLTPLSGQAGHMKLDATVTGSMDKPILNADGKLLLETLSAQGLGEVVLSITTALENNKPLGHATIHSTYRDMPVMLDTDFEYNDPVLSLFSIKGTAPDVKLSGNISLDTSALLADGKIDLNATKLETYADLAGAVVGGSGFVGVVLGKADTKQSVALEASLSKLRYDDMSVASLQAQAEIPDVALLWPKSLEVKASNAVLSTDEKITALNLNLSETAAQSYHVMLDAKGQAMKPFQLKGTTDIALIENKPEAKNIDLKLISTGASVAVTGSASEAALNLAAKLQNLTAALVPVDLPDPLSSMSASGDVTLTGTTAAPIIDTTLDFSTLKIRDNLPSVKISATGSYQEALAKLDVVGIGEGIRTLKGQAELPVSLSLYPFAFSMSDAAPLKGNVDFDLSGTRLLASLLPPDHKFTGDLKGQVQLAGTMTAPQASGNLSVNGATYLYEPFGVKLHDLALEAALSDTQIKLNKLSATDGGKGSLSGNGIVDFKNAAQTALNLKISDYHLAHSQMVDGVVGADLSLKGQGTGYLLGGNVKLGPLDIVIPEQFKSTIPQLNIVTDDKPAGPNETLQSIALNISVAAENQIFVRGWGLDAEFGGAITATGTLDNPQLNGDFTSKRGRYEEFGKRFTLEKAALRFQGSLPPSPYLDIEAQTNAGDVVASVLLTGSVTKPKINFSSVPSLPEDEVLSRILFGRNMDRITPFQAVQLAQTLQRFSGKGGSGFDPLGEIRSLTGLDDISVDTDESGETSVGVGKYLTDKVYIQLEKGQGDTSGAASIQVEVTPSVNVESRVGQDAQTGGGVFWKHDY